MTAPSTPRRGLVLVLALIVPLALALVQAAAGNGATARADDIRAAVVNEDEIVTLTAPDGTEQPVAVGRLLVAELTANDQPDDFRWTITHREEAMIGLRDGTYGAVLVIPREVSAAAVSPAGEDPSAATTARLRLITDDATSRRAGQLAGNITQAAVAAVNAQVAETFIDTVVVSTSVLRDGLVEAAGGAGQLADGTAELSVGAGQLADGADQLRDGTGTLADGTSHLAGGAARAATGAGQLAGGIAQLDDGAHELRRRTAALPEQAAQLNQGAQQLHDGARQLDAGARELVATVEPFLQMAQQLTDVVVSWAGQCDRVLPPPACAQVAEAVHEVQRVNAEVQALGAQGTSLTDGTGRLAEGLGQLSAATQQLAAQAPELSGGIGQLADGSARLRAGAAELAGGTAQLASGARELDSGARAIHGGSGALADGAGQLADGSRSLADGSSELADGLREGADEIPVYSPEERAQLSQVAAAPLRTAAERHHRVPLDAAMIPGAVTIGLLAASAVAWAVSPALSRSRLVASQALVRQLAGPLRRALGLVAVQLTLLLVGTALLLDLGTIARPVAFGAITVTAALALTLLGQGLVAAFGRLPAAVLAVVAASTALSVVPGSAVNSILRAASPLTPVIEGLAAAQAGVDVGSSLLALTGWGVLGTAVTIVAAQRARADLRWLLPTG